MYGHVKVRGTGVDEWLGRWIRRYTHIFFSLFLFRRRTMTANARFWTARAISRLPPEISPLPSLNSGNIFYEEGKEERQLNPGMPRERGKSPLVFRASSPAEAQDRSLRCGVPERSHPSLTSACLYGTSSLRGWGSCDLGLQGIKRGISAENGWKIVLIRSY